jgi:hypothetical protein
VGKAFFIIACIFSLGVTSCISGKKDMEAGDGFSGSGSCIKCHERFYELWSTSYHGKAMQPVNGSFLTTENIMNSEVFSLEGKTYHILIEDSAYDYD